MCHASAVADEIVTGRNQVAARTRCDRAARSDDVHMRGDSGIDHRDDYARSSHAIPCRLKIGAITSGAAGGR